MNQNQNSIETMEMSNAIVITGIQKGDIARETILKAIYLNLDLKKQVKYLVLKRGCYADVEDVFTETLILFDRAVRENKFKGKGSWKGFFMTIAKRFWWKKEFFSILEEPETIVDPEEIILLRERKQIAHQIMQQLDSRSKELLMLNYFGNSMKEIAEKLNIKSIELTRQQVCRARTKLENLIENSFKHIILYA
jgi:RNA polymerase sigma factor (sigma-70 family)